DQVGCRYAATQLALELDTHYVRSEDVKRLAEHAGFGFDTAHAPAHNTNAVDHGGVTVCADQGVGVINVVLGVVMHAAGQMLEVDLVDDAKTRRHDSECVKRLHAPFHELVSLFVALKLEFHVEVKRLVGAVVIDHYRVVDNQVDRNQGLDLFWVLAHARSHGAHRCDIGQQWNAGEILKHYASDNERNFGVARRVWLPRSEEHTSELQSRENLVCRLLLEKKKYQR